MKRSIVGAAVAAALVLSGCGSSPVDAISNQAQLTAAIDRTLSAKTSKIDTKLESEFVTDPSESTGEPGEKIRVKIAGSGVFDYAHDTGSFTAKLDATDLSPAATLEEVIDGTTLYSKETLNASGITDLWDKKDLAGEAQRGETIEFLGSGMGRPVGYLGMLRDGVENIEKVGNEDVRGAKTKHYKMNVDLAKSAATATGVEKAGLEDLKDSSTGPAAAELWIDSKGLVRKFALTFQVSQNSENVQDGLRAARMELELYDFNTPVDVQMPSEDEVSTDDESDDLDFGLGEESKLTDSSTSSTSSTSTTADSDTAR